MLPFAFYSRGHRGTEMFSNLSKATKPKSCSWDLNAGSLVPESVASDTDVLPESQLFQPKLLLLTDVSVTILLSSYYSKSFASP